MRLRNHPAELTFVSDVDSKSTPPEKPNNPIAVVKLSQYHSCLAATMKTITSKHPKKTVFNPIDLLKNNVSKSMKS
jgi:hypothetical protein